jgi:glycosyltransferase involved in cell wall biosynthesis
VTVTLLSNIPHYHYLAGGLYEDDLLRHYLTSTSLFAGQTAPAWLPHHWQLKLEGRRLPELPHASVKQIRLPELLQRGLPRLRLLSKERGNCLNNYLFDKLAARWVEDSEVLHFVSSVGLYSARKAKANGATIVCDVRQEHPAFQRRILEEEARHFTFPISVAGWSYEQKVLDELALADFIFVPSEYAKRTYLAEGFPSERLVTLPYGVDLEHFSPSSSAASGFRVLYVGALTFRKGVQYLLEAFSKVRLPHSELLLVGPMDPAFRPVLARYEGLFTYHPAAPKTKLRDFYTAASVFVLPSLADSFSLATVEAMACGLPVIISANTGAADLLTDQEDGFVLPIRDVPRLIEVLCYLFHHREAREAVGQRARRTAAAQTWKRYGETAALIYRQKILADSVYA